MNKTPVPRRMGVQYYTTTSLCFVSCTVSGQPFMNVFTVTWLHAYSLHAELAIPQGLLCPQLPTPT